jgi:hypothetical protein
MRRTDASRTDVSRTEISITGVAKTDASQARARVSEEHDGRSLRVYVGTLSLRANFSCALKARECRRMQPARDHACVMVGRREEASSAHVAGEKQRSFRGIAQLLAIEHHREIVLGRLLVANMETDGLPRMHAISERDTPRCCINGEHRPNEIIAAPASLLGAIQRKPNKKSLPNTRAIGFRKCLDHLSHGVDGSMSVQGQHVVSASGGHNEITADWATSLAHEAGDIDVAKDRKSNESSVRKMAIDREDIEPSVRCSARDTAENARAFRPSCGVDCGTSLARMNRVGIGEENRSAMRERAATRAFVGRKRDPLSDEALTPHRRRAVFKVEPEGARNDAGSRERKHRQARCVFDLARAAHDALHRGREQVRWVQFPPQKVERIAQERPVMKAREDEQHVCAKW